jgi:hypothetical protein
MNALSGMHSEQSECLAGLAPNLAETKMYSMYMNTDPDNNNGTTGQFAKYWYNAATANQNACFLHIDISLYVIGKCLHGLALRIPGGYLVGIGH